MFAPATVPFTTCIDPFLSPARNDEDFKGLSRRPRLEPIQRVIEAMGNILLSEDVAVMAKFTVAKIVHLLQAEQKMRIRHGQVGSFSMRNEASQVLQALALDSAEGQALADGLNSLLDELEWYCGQSGPYAQAPTLLVVTLTPS